MSSTKFKLTKRDGLTRRFTFPDQPTWETLAGRIHELFEIPIDAVGVSYVDSDDDTVTISTAEELWDYYQTIHQPAEVIKFMVQDLRSRNEKALPDTPRSTTFRNTFGVKAGSEGLPFDIEDDWQRLPTLGGMFVPTEDPMFRVVPPESPHAFIRTVDSDATASSVHDDESDDESDANSTMDYGNVMPSVDKGKGRAMDPSPAPSVVADDLVSISSNDRHVIFETKTESLPDSPHSTVIAVAVEDAPEVFAEAAEVAEESALAPEAVSTAEDPTDPPLPTIDATPAPRPASLTTDVAELLTTLTNVVSSHPELSEGLRNIVQNATNGTYWTAHRAAVSQAADEFMQSTGDAADNVRRRGEEEAGRRVAEALGGMLRTFSEALGGTSAETTPAPAPAPVPPVDDSEPWRTSTPADEQFNSTSFWYGSIPGPRLGRGYGGRRGRWGAPNGPQHGPFHVGPPPGPFHHGSPPREPPPGPPPHMGGPFQPYFHHHHHPRGASWDGPGPWGPPPPPNPPAQPQPSRPKPTPQELRAQVEAAKLLYKAEKERYRAEREERKREKDLRMGVDSSPNAQTLVDTAPAAPAAPVPPVAPVAHLVSTGNPRVGYPKLEMYSVPHRNNTYHGQSSRRHAPENPTDRVIHRITKRLAAMGITENAHPELPAKIKEQLPEGTLTEDAENNIVSNLVEELVFISSPKPTASGSGLRNADAELPGAWA